MRNPLSERQRQFLRALWYVLAGLITALSLAPGSSAPIRWIATMDFSDKLLHAAGYLPLALLPVLHERRRRVALMVAVAMLLGVLLEFGQSTVAGRAFDPSDMLANSAGLAVGLLAGWPFRVPAGS